MVKSQRILVVVHMLAFQEERDARRFLHDLRERFAKFALELHPEKTRIVRFGRFAAAIRARRGEGKPETFDFLGFTHICGRSKAGKFLLHRRTMRTRMTAKLRELATELRQRRHRPVPEQGAWLQQVVRGYFAYHAVPTNTHRMSAFRTQVIRHWHRALQRRGQRDRTTWARMTRLVARWIPPARVLHPWPWDRFDARTRGKSPVR